MPGLPRLKNIADHKRNGTYRTTRHKGQRSPSAPLGHPVKPDSLDPLASASWDAVIVSLDAMEITHTIDGHAVEQYAKLYAETEGIADQRIAGRVAMDSLTTTIQSLRGVDLANAVASLVDLAKLDAKHVDQLRNGRNAIRLFLVEFGLTPASRNRIRLPEATPDTADPFATLANGRPA